jgi:hypothetical protein
MTYGSTDEIKTTLFMMPRWPLAEAHRPSDMNGLSVTRFSRRHWSINGTLLKLDDAANRVLSAAPVAA